MSRRDLIRMGDYKFIADVAFAQHNGIHTTKSKELDTIYREFDREFPQQDEFSLLLKAGLSGLIDLIPLHNTVMFKQHIAYAIALAFIAGHGRDQRLLDVVAAHQPDRFPGIDYLNFEDLLGLLESDLEDHTRHPFVVACSQRTNVRETREIRFSYCYNAMLRLGENDANN